MVSVADTMRLAAGVVYWQGGRGVMGLSARFRLSLFESAADSHRTTTRANSMLRETPQWLEWDGFRARMGWQHRARTAGTGTGASGLSDLDVSKCAGRFAKRAAPSASLPAGCARRLDGIFTAPVAPDPKLLHGSRADHGPTGLVTPRSTTPHEVADEGRPEEMESIPTESTWTLWHRWRPIHARARCRTSNLCLDPRGAVGA